MHTNLAIAILIIVAILVIRGFSCTSSNDESSDENRSIDKKSHFKWTVQHLVDLDKIYQKVDPRKKFYRDRMKQEWDELYPHSNVSCSALYQKARSNHMDLTRVPNPSMVCQWTEELNKELIDIYYDTYPGEVNHTMRMNDKWKEKHPNDPERSSGSLLQRARKLIKENPSYRREEVSERDFQLTNQQKSDLLHIYRNVIPVKEGFSKKIHDYWSAMYPHLAYMTTQQLLHRAECLHRDPQEKDPSWTKEQDEDLLKIYHATSPEREDQGLRIHEEWSQMHPKYNFMTPHYLQVHASNLADGSLKSKSGRRKAVKFTEQQDTYLMKLYEQFSQEKGMMLKIRQEWSRKYPKLAFIPEKHLMMKIKRDIKRRNGVIPDPEKSGANRIIKAVEGRQCKRFTPELDSELVNLFDKTYPKEMGHSNRLYKKWTAKHRDHADIKPYNLRLRATRVKRRQMGMNREKNIQAPGPNFPSEDSKTQD